jgi:2-polyprenyl-6-methoxyphenol hydroxylase-like FAD-dependent oxidoreductase
VNSAIVVGGGIGGLSAAIALRRAGREVTVLERAPELREVGAGLTLMANAVRGLATLGLADAVRRRGLAETAGGLRTSSGRWLSHVGGAELARLLGSTAVGIHRAALHRILRDALPAAVLRTNADVLDVRDESGGAVVEYRQDGELTGARADLVVGADGIRSVVRDRLWPGATTPVYAGSTAWRAAIRWDAPLPAAISWGHGEEFGMVPIGDGQVYWYGAVWAPPGGTNPDELAAVRERFGSWHDPIPALIAATPPDAVLRNDILHLDRPLPTYVRGRVVLLGDAAHAMTPNLGQGACQAIEDAVVLGALVAAGAPLAEYDRQRRPRSQEVAKAAYLIGRVGHQLRNPLAVALRNTVMRLTPARVSLRSMTRYADWQPPIAPSHDHEEFGSS